MAMKLYTLDDTCLENARAGLKQPFSPLQLALSKLVSEADILRREAPESVVHKKLRPASGDAHDYYSLGPTGGQTLGGPTGCPIFAATGILIRSVRTTTRIPRALSVCANGA